MDPHSITPSNETIANTLASTSSRNPKSLPKDFISFEDALGLIQSDTRQDPKVDIQALVNAIPYMTPRNNCGFTLRLLARNSEGQIIRTGIRYVSLDSEYKCTTFEHTVAQKYEELTRQAIAPQVRSVSSVVNDTDNVSGQLRSTDDALKKIGEDI